MRTNRTPAMSVPLHGALPADTGGPAQELLDLALVAVLTVGRAQCPDAHRLGVLEDRLTAGVGEVVARTLELAVVLPAPVAELIEDLFGQPDPGRPQRGGGQGRPPRRQDRGEWLFPQARGLPQRETARGRGGW